MLRRRHSFIGLHCSRMFASFMFSMHTHRHVRNMKRPQTNNVINASIGEKGRSHSFAVSVSLHLTVTITVALHSQALYYINNIIQ